MPLVSRSHWRTGAAARSLQALAVRHVDRHAPQPVRSSCKPDEADTSSPAHAVHQVCQDAHAAAHGALVEKLQGRQAVDGRRAKLLLPHAAHEARGCGGAGQGAHRRAGGTGRGPAPSALKACLAGRAGVKRFMVLHRPCPWCSQSGSSVQTQMCTPAEPQDARQRGGGGGGLHRSAALGGAPAAEVRRQCCPLHSSFNTQQRMLHSPAWRAPPAVTGPSTLQPDPSLPWRRSTAWWPVQQCRRAE